MKFAFFCAAALAAMGSFWTMPGCSAGLNIDLSIPEGGLPDGGNLALPRGVGEACQLPTDCRPGLACPSGTCQPGRSAAPGTDCVISAECIADHYCGPERKCAPAGAGEPGATCTFDGECKAGLRCNLVGFAAQCQPEGTKDVGGACTAPAECFGGLLCAQDKCAPNPPGIPPLVIPKFTGVACEAETGDVSAYFEVPRGAALKDYFRLPYPNDIRLGANGKPDMTDFPRPGPTVLPFDLVDRWAGFVSSSPNIDGYSAYPTTIFRFSGELDFASLEAKDATNYVDLTDAQPLAHLWTSSTGRTQYVCPNALSVRPPTGGALKPGHQYAVFVTTATKAKDGKAIVRSPDLIALLGPTDPGGALAGPWKQYAPLRGYAATKSIPVDTILNAAVFTVGKHDAIGRALPGLVDGSPAPAATDWVKCGGAAKSPCAQADSDRACPATPAAGIDEYHALITLPLFQEGTEPFIEVADKGGFVNAVTSRTVKVCAALTVKTGATGVLDTLIYAHGTGGSFRSHTSADNVGTRMAAKDIAVLGIDQVGHGTRRGASTSDPSLIFFNFPNPAAAQGNVLQGAADQVALVRLLKAGVTVPNAPFTLGGTGKIAFWGHSQGATEGAIGMPYVSGVSGVVFSGQGASLIDSLLTKTSPVNFAALAPALLADAPANVNVYHPVLSMFQNAIDPADPLDHAANATGAGGVPKHLFVPYGQADTFATPITQQTYIAAASLDIASPPPTVATPDKLYKDPVAKVTANKPNNITAASRQYAKPANSDGHFVAFRDPDARKDVDTFLADVMKAAVPAVPAP